MGTSPIYKPLNDHTHDNFPSPDLPHHSRGQQNRPGSEQTGFGHHLTQCWADQVKGGTGKEVATNYQIKYIETSPGENPTIVSQCERRKNSGINHNVDELLVGLVTQIHLRRREASSMSASCKVSIFYHFFIIALQGHCLFTCSLFHDIKSTPVPNSVRGD